MVRAEKRLKPAALVTMRAAVDSNDGFTIAEYTGNFAVQVVQRVAVLGKDNNLAMRLEAI